ncbi:glycosyl hydrolase [Larkinella terrae]|uniref:Glycoside hydrolase n=1 Tax=Larkinella terrae TaxID=2025311 RepID=A0A7K0ERI5_9BACT|nr:glycosyl hydrolase [Larkinella terrae]MRS64382.1 hypothetical protein [Larkinella terrae]
MKKSTLIIGLVSLAGLACGPEPKTSSESKEWFPYFDFDASTFQKAPRAFGPFTRWWLPGNDITSEELQREIKTLADNGFAGVEVQPLTMGTNPNAPKAQVDRVNSWDTPSFYEHLRAIMQQAQQSEVVVDMNGGSGWPLGGAFFDPKESMKTLAITDTSLAGGQTFSGELPRPQEAHGKPTGMLAMMLQKNPVKPEWASLKSVIAARETGKSDNQAVLDPKSLVDLTDKVSGGKLNWQAPTGGNWRIVAAWSIPTGEKPSLIASSKTNYVIDHLDPVVVDKTYDYLLGDRTGLPAYYGKPLRAVFNDSYEFHTDRIISPDFLKVFREKNGYDIAPYLGAVFQKGYNHPTYLASMYKGAKPPFTFNITEGWRLMHDYDLAVNEVFKTNFIKASDGWMQKRGMLHRTQAYGFPIDVIGAAGAADIPEAEQLFAEGSEGYLKLVTSGAHLYNKPVITQESFVSIFRAEMTTPQKIKVWADKSFACGINQLIYHGTPYKYNPGEYGKEGWNTWSSPFNAFVNFSTGMNESDPFWKDIKTVNQYLARCQYALRSGKPQTDVLIYMPFNDFSEDQLALNPNEILYRGYFEGVEPKEVGAFGTFEAPKTPLNTWYKELWKTVNALEANGISWEFVNDESLQKATFANGKLTVNESQYQGLILANLPYIDLASAKHVNALSKQGLPIWAVGKLPQKQPSFLDYAANDQQTAQLMNEVGQQKTTKTGFDETAVASIRQSIRFAKPVDFSRQITRLMQDGSQLKFIWNKTDQWQTIALNLDGMFTSGYWLNPENGKIETATGKAISYELPPYGSVMLYASVKTPIAAALVSAPDPTLTSKTSELLKLSTWNITVGDVSLKNSQLLDWRLNDQLKYKSDESVYTATFNVKTVDPAIQYVVDLGKVFFTANVTVNNQSVGKRLFAPYQLDVTKFLKPGENNLTVQVTTSRRNGFIGEAVKGNNKYAQFKGKENTLLPAGLAGPVRILGVSRNSQQ